MSELTPYTREEHFLNDIAQKLGGGTTADLTPYTREEHFMQNIADAIGSGGSGLPSYSSADIGKSLTVGEDAEHPTQQTVIPEQTVTLVDTYGTYIYLFDENDGVNKSFFQNAQVGDTCTITIGGESVESTAVSLNGETLFPVGDYYVGYAIILGGTGVACLGTPPLTTITISATAIAPSVSVGYNKIPFVVELYYVSGTPTFSKTYDEIMTAYKNNVPIFFKKEDNSLINFYSNVRYMNSTFEAGYWDIRYSGNTPILFYHTATIGDDDSVTLEEIAYVELTPYTP